MDVRTPGVDAIGLNASVGSYMSNDMSMTVRHEPWDNCNAIDIVVIGAENMQLRDVDELLFTKASLIITYFEEYGELP